MVETLCPSGCGARVANLVMELRRNGRGPQGTFTLAILRNGSLYCSGTPKALFEFGPLARDASLGEAEAHDRQTAELSCDKLGKITKPDTDGHHRVVCPAVVAKCRCPLRPDSMELSSDHPKVFYLPNQAPRCCLQMSLTVPPSINAKTAQSPMHGGAPTSVAVPVSKALNQVMNS
ncbi:MAG: hypothetical protein ABSB52_10645 [Acidimicrobiales bacterium]